MPIKSIVAFLKSTLNFPFKLLSCNFWGWCFSMWLIHNFMKSQNHSFNSHRIMHHYVLNSFCSTSNFWQANVFCFNDSFTWLIAISVIVTRCLEMCFIGFEEFGTLSYLQVYCLACSTNSTICLNAWQYMLLWPSV